MVQNKHSGAIVYWIDQTGSIRSEVLLPHHLRGSATYLSEAIWITDNAEHMVVIMMDRAEDPFEKERLERLKGKADAIRKALA